MIKMLAGGSRLPTASNLINSLEALEAAALLFNFHFRRPKASKNPGIITSLKPTTSLPLEVGACETILLGNPNFSGAMRVC